MLAAVSHTLAAASTCLPLLKVLEIMHGLVFRLDTQADHSDNCGHDCGGTLLCERLP
jgi:hypothetical protein